MRRTTPSGSRTVPARAGSIIAGTWTLMDLLAGAVWLRAVFRRLPLDEDFARKTVAAVLDGVRTP